MISQQEVKRDRNGSFEGIFIRKYCNLVEEIRFFYKLCLKGEVANLSFIII